MSSSSFFQAFQCDVIGKKYHGSSQLLGNFYLTITSLYMIHDIYHIYLIKNASNICGQKFFETRNLNENDLARPGTHCPVTYTDAKPSFIFVNQPCLLFSFFHGA